MGAFEGCWGMVRDGMLLCVWTLKLNLESIDQSIVFVLAYYWTTHLNLGPLPTHTPSQSVRPWPFNSRFGSYIIDLNKSAPPHCFPFKEIAVSHQSKESSFNDGREPTRSSFAHVGRRRSPRSASAVESKQQHRNREQRSEKKVRIEMSG